MEHHTEKEIPDKLTSEVCAILDEFYPDGLPPSVTAEVANQAGTLCVGMRDHPEPVLPNRVKIPSEVSVTLTA